MASRRCQRCTCLSTGSPLRPPSRCRRPRVEPDRPDLPGPERNGEAAVRRDLDRRTGTPEEVHVARCRDPAGQVDRGSRRVGPPRRRAAARAPGRAGGAPTGRRRRRSTRSPWTAAGARSAGPVPAATMAGRRDRSAARRASASVHDPAWGRIANPNCHGPRSWAPGTGISGPAGSSRKGFSFRLIRPVERRTVRASSRPSTSSYSVTWSSRTVAPATWTKPWAGKVGSGTSPCPASAVRPRSTTANWPSAAVRSVARWQRQMPADPVVARRVREGQARPGRTARLPGARAGS